MLTALDLFMTTHLSPAAPMLATVSLQQLPASCVVLCATQRLAQQLSQSHDQHADKSASWATLQSKTFGQWLQERYAAMALRGCEPPGLQGLRVLDGFQERLVWEQIIHQSLGPNDALLFDIGALAATAADAHALTINWGIPAFTGATAFASEEQRRFCEWQSAFLKRCNELNLIDGARLNAELIRQLEADSLRLPEWVVFAGFDHYTPLEVECQRQLERIGARLGILAQDALPIKPTPEIGAAETIDAECLAVAHWAKAQLAGQSNARIGIVAPDLANYQHPLADALEDVLDPTLVLPGNALQRRPFNISLGQPLAASPVVRTALTILQVLTQHHAVEQPMMRTLLASPYWSRTNENDARARLDSAMREGIAPKAPLSRYCDFAEYLFEKQSVRAPATLGFLNSLGAATRTLGKQRPPSEWRRVIRAVLGNGGWLANDHLRSHEFQTREAFGKELGKLAQLDQITGSIAFSKAVSLLTQLCAERLFQPKTRGTPPIQVLGVLEATGMRFDAVWIMGVTGTAWPPPANPNPLLPAEVLRAAGAPNASASVQLDFAQRIQTRLLESAPIVRISYPHMDNATEQQPSPLIRHLGAAKPINPLPAAWVADLQRREAPLLETLMDALAPPVGEGDTVGGGTALLRAQAICPAWGYFQYRLGAKALAKPVEGLDPRKRGTLIHDTLERFWKETQSLATLKTMNDDDRRAAVTAAAKAALAQFNNDRKREALKPRQAMLEERRLVRLVDEWLQLELTRKEDFVVLEAEAKREVQVAGIVARMQIDRIDQLSDGRTVIIDYKTGADIDISNWAADRITEPQLPVYAAIAEHASGIIAGVAFGLVHITGAEFKGVGQDNHLLPGVHAMSSERGRKLFDTTRFPDWSSVIDHWRQAIHRVAQEVRDGKAGVSITSDNDIRFCEVRPLLRLAERQTQLDAAIAADKTGGGA